jgi:hypothetical protein
MIPVYNRLSFIKKDAYFWEHPENAPFANELMLRFLFYQSVKFIVGKDSLFVGNNYHTGDYKIISEIYFYFLLHLYGMLKCGSASAIRLAKHSNHITSLDEGQVSFRALYRAFDGYEDCYYRLVYILNELSPCNCLETEVKRAKEEQEEGQKRLTLGCSNDDCNETESSDNKRFSRCAGCKLAQYCSRRCYKDHWSGHTASAESSQESSHKIACGAIQELKSILAAAGGGRGAIGDSLA